MVQPQDLCDPQDMVFKKDESSEEEDYSEHEENSEHDNYSEHNILPPIAADQFRMSIDSAELVIEAAIPIEPQVNEAEIPAPDNE